MERRNLAMAFSALHHAAELRLRKAIVSGGRSAVGSSPACLARNRPCPGPCGAADWRGWPNVRLPIPIAAFRAQGRLSQLSATSGLTHRTKSSSFRAFCRCSLLQTDRRRLSPARELAQAPPWHRRPLGILKKIRPGASPLDPSGKEVKIKEVRASDRPGNPRRSSG